MKASVNLEKVRLENFFMYCTRESFTRFRSKQDRDLEATGNCFLEVVRGAKGNIQGFTHLPSYQMRLAKVEDEQNYVDRTILELQEDWRLLLDLFAKPLCVQELA